MQKNPREEDEPRVNGLKIWQWSALPCQRDFLGPVCHKMGEAYKKNGTGLGVTDEAGTLWRVVVKPLLCEEASKETAI
jgi:hypothetical protein